MHTSDDYRMFSVLKFFRYVYKDKAEQRLSESLINLNKHLAKLQEEQQREKERNSSAQQASRRSILMLYQWAGKLVGRLTGEQTRP